MNVAYVRASGAVAYVDRLRDFIDKWLFFVFFVLGATAIVALKIAEFAQWQVTTAPVALMFLYALYTYFSPGFRLREDRIADNLYYLGFLYTLTSLAYSLYLFSQDQGGTTAIIANFGIALVTTIVGLALRVLFSQLREDPLEFEREARHDLSEAVHHLKTELDQSVLEFNSFRRALQQGLQEGFDEMLTNSRTLLLKHGQQYSHVTNRFVAEFDQAIATFAHESARANAGIASTATELASLTARINAIEAPRDLVKRKIEPAVAAMTHLVEQTFAHTQSETLYFDRLHTLLEKVGESHQQLEQTLTRLGEAYRQQTATLEQETEQVQAVVTTLRHLAVEASAGIQRQADVQTQQLERFSRSTEALIEQHQQALGSELQLMRDRLRALAQEGAARQATLGQELEQLHQVVTGLGQVQAPLERLDQSISAQMNALARLTGSHQEAATQAERYSTALNQALETARQGAEALAHSGGDHAATFHASLNRLEQALAAAVDAIGHRIQDQTHRIDALQGAIAQRTIGTGRRWFGWIKKS